MWDLPFLIGLIGVKSAGYLLLMTFATASGPVGVLVSGVEVAVSGVEVAISGVEVAILGVDIAVLGVEAVVALGVEGVAEIAVLGVGTAGSVVDGGFLKKSRLNIK